MISLKSSGSYKNIESLLKKMKANVVYDLDQYGKMGVEALRRATPTDTGVTARSWTYTVNRTPGKQEIIWYNTNTHNGENIAILIQYGHGTGNGGYIVGRDYINPAIQPLFDKIANEVWKKVTRA